MVPQLVGHIAFSPGFSLSGDSPSSFWKSTLEWKEESFIIQQGTGFYLDLVGLCESWGASV